MNIRSMLSRINEHNQETAISLSSPKHLNVKADSDITRKSGDATLDSIRRIENRRLQRQLTSQLVTIGAQDGILYGNGTHPTSRKLFLDVPDIEADRNSEIILDPFDPLYKAKKDLEALRQKREYAVKERLLRNAEELDRLEKQKENAIEKARKDKANSIALHHFKQIHTKLALVALTYYTQSRIRLKFIYLQVKMFKENKAFYQLKRTVSLKSQLRIRGIAYGMKLAGKRLIHNLLFNRNTRYFHIKVDILGGRHYVRRLARRAIKELRETSTHRLRRLISAGNYSQKKLVCRGFKTLVNWCRLSIFKLKVHRLRLQSYLDQKKFILLCGAIFCFSVFRAENQAVRKAVVYFETSQLRNAFELMKKVLNNAQYRDQLYGFADDVFSHALQRKYLRHFRQRVREIRRFQLRRQRFRRVTFFKNPQSVMMNYFSTWYRKHMDIKRRNVMVVKQIERLRNSKSTLHTVLQRLRVRWGNNLNKEKGQQYITVHQFYKQSIYLMSLNRVWRKFCVRIFEAAQRRLIKGRPRLLVASTYFRQKQLKSFWNRWYNVTEKSLRIYQKCRKLRFSKILEVARSAVRKWRSHSIYLIKYDLARFHHKRRTFADFLNNLRSLINTRQTIRRKRDKNPILRKLSLQSLQKWFYFAAKNCERRSLIRFMRSKVYERRINFYLQEWIAITHQHSVDEGRYRCGKVHWSRKTVKRALRQWFRATYHFRKKQNGSFKQEGFVNPSKKFSNSSSVSSKSNLIKMATKEVSRKQQLLSKGSSFDQPLGSEIVCGKSLSVYDQWYILVMKSKYPILQIKRYFKIWSILQRNLVMANKIHMLHGNQHYRIKTLKLGMSKWIEKYEKRIEIENLLGYYRINIQIPSLVRKVMNKLKECVHERTQRELVLEESGLHYTRTVGKLLLHEWKQRIQFRLESFRPAIRESDVHFCRWLQKKYWSRFHSLLENRFDVQMEMKRSRKYYKMKKTKPLLSRWKEYSKVSLIQYKGSRLAKSKSRGKIIVKFMTALQIFFKKRRNCQLDYDVAKDFHFKKTIRKALQFWFNKTKSLKIFKKKSSNMIRRWFQKFVINKDQNAKKRLTWRKSCRNYTKIAAKELLRQWKKRIQIHLHSRKPLIRKSVHHFHKILLKKYIKCWEDFLHSKDVKKYEEHLSASHYNQKIVKPSLENWRKYCCVNKRQYSVSHMAKVANWKRQCYSIIHQLKLNALFCKDLREQFLNAKFHYVNKCLKKSLENFKTNVQYQRFNYQQQNVATTHYHNQLVRTVFNKVFKVLLQEHALRMAKFLSVVNQIFHKALFRVARKRLQSYFEDWKKDTLVERKVALKLKFHHKQWYYQAFHKLKRRSRQSKRLKRKVYGFIQLMLYKQRKLVVNQRDSPNTVNISFDCDIRRPHSNGAISKVPSVDMEMPMILRTSSFSEKINTSSKSKSRKQMVRIVSKEVPQFKKPANFYHDGLRFMQSLLQLLEKKRVEEDMLEHAQFHHEMMAKRFVIHQLFHLRRNRIAMDFFLKCSFKRLKSQLLINKRKYSFLKELSTRSTGFTLKRYLKKWTNYLITQFERKHVKEKRNKRFPIFQQIHSFEYYWNYHKRLFLLTLKKLKKSKRKTIKKLAYYDNLHLYHTMYRGFHSLAHIVNRKRKVKRNNYLLSLFEKLQVKRRAIRVWHNLVGMRFLHVQRNRLHVQCSIANQPRGTVRFDRHVQRAFKCLLQRVVARKEREYLMKHPEKRKEYLIKMRSARMKKVEVIGNDTLDNSEVNPIELGSEKLQASKKIRENKALQSISLSRVSMKSI